jgi:hypothetical protein
LFSTQSPWLPWKSIRRSKVIDQLSFVIFRSNTVATVATRRKKKCRFPLNLLRSGSMKQAAALLLLLFISGLEIISAKDGDGP